MTSYPIPYDLIPVRWFIGNFMSNVKLIALKGKAFRQGGLIILCPFLPALHHARYRACR
jgi:hypothetical protein